MRYTSTSMFAVPPSTVRERSFVRGTVSMGRRSRAPVRGPPPCFWDNASVRPRRAQIAESGTDSEVVPSAPDRRLGVQFSTPIEAPASVVLCARLAEFRPGRTRRGRKPCSRATTWLRGAHALAHTPNVDGGGSTKDSPPHHRRVRGARFVASEGSQLASADAGLARCERRVDQRKKEGRACTSRSGAPHRRPGVAARQ